MRPSVPQPEDDAVRGMEEGQYRINDPRYLQDEPPKQIWRHMAAEARALGFQGGSWCDVGCASGSLLRYLGAEFYLTEMVGVDPAAELLARASIAGRANATWIQDSLPKLEALEGLTFDAVSCIGVLCLMDDLEVNLASLGKLVRPGGHLFIIDLINDKPIDMIMRFRHAGSSAWQVAYNTFSMETYRIVARDIGMDVSFSRANMPFAIPEGPDPMKSWTTQVGKNPFQVVSGTGQILMQTLAILDRPLRGQEMSSSVSFDS